ncbi:MAG: FecR domain-containing protein [Clostridia bacterium]|nr:FecR domain-containing protein [Clostridia bacterium]
MTIIKKPTLGALFLGLLVMVFCLLYISDGTQAAQKSLTARNISILSVDGDNAQVNPGGKKNIKATAGMRLGQGYTIKTGASTMLYFQVDDDKAIKMADNSSVSISKASGNKLNITLLKGELFFNIKKPVEDGKAVSFSAGGTSMGIRGTKGGISFAENNLLLTNGGLPTPHFYIFSGQGMLWQEQPNGNPPQGGQPPQNPTLILNAGQGVGVPPGSGLSGLAPTNFDPNNLSHFQLVGLSENGGSGGSLPPGLQKRIDDSDFDQLLNKLREQQDQKNKKQQENKNKIDQDNRGIQGSQHYNNPLNGGSSSGNNENHNGNDNQNQTRVNAEVLYYDILDPQADCELGTYTGGNVNYAHIKITDLQWGTNAEHTPLTAPVYTLTDITGQPVNVQYEFVFNQNENKWEYLFQLVNTGTYHLTVYENQDENNSTAVFEKTISIFNEKPSLQVIQPQGYGFGVNSNNITFTYTSLLGNYSSLNMGGTICYCLARESANAFSDTSAADIITAVIKETEPEDFSTVQDCLALGSGTFSYVNGACQSGSINLNDLDYGTAYRLAVAVVDEAGNFSDFKEVFFVTGMENKPDLVLAEIPDSSDVTVSLSNLNEGIINNYYGSSPLAAGQYAYYVFFANSISNFNEGLSGQEMVETYFGIQPYAQRLDKNISTLSSTITASQNDNGYYSYITSSDTARFYIVMSYKTQLNNDDIVSYSEPIEYNLGSLAFGEQLPTYQLEHVNYHSTEGVCSLHHPYPDDNATWMMLGEYSPGDIAVSFRLSGSGLVDGLKLLYGLNGAYNNSALFIPNGTDFTINIDNFDENGPGFYVINAKLVAPNLVDQQYIVIYLTEPI